MLNKAEGKLHARIVQNCEQPYVELNPQEHEFFNMSKSLKGLQMSSSMQRDLRQQGQKRCFQAQRAEFVDHMIVKKRKADRRQAEFLVQQHKSVDTAQEARPKKEVDNFLAWSEEDIPAEAKALEVYVMQQIELDNLRDIEDPFVFVHNDSRANKVEIPPLTIAPDGDLKQQKLTFEDSAFWYMKGYEAERVKHMESAIDSYRQAIRLDTRCSAAMVNLAAQYEEQHRFDTACKWYKIAMKIDPACL